MDKRIVPSITPYDKECSQSRILSLPRGEGARRADEGKSALLFSLATLVSFPPFRFATRIFDLGKPKCTCPSPFGTPLSRHREGA